MDCDVMMFSVCNQQGVFALGRGRHWNIPHRFFAGRLAECRIPFDEKPERTRADTNQVHIATGNAKPRAKKNKNGWGDRGQNQCVYVVLAFCFFLVSLLCVVVLLDASRRIARAPSTPINVPTRSDDAESARTPKPKGMPQKWMHTPAERERERGGSNETLFCTSTATLFFIHPHNFRRPR